MDSKNTTWVPNDDMAADLSAQHPANKQMEIPHY